MIENDLISLQRPIKERYLKQPDEARVTLEAGADLDKSFSWDIRLNGTTLQTGLHPSVGGDGSAICPGALFLHSISTCFGVTLSAVAAYMGIEMRRGSITTEGDLDLRGTLGIEGNAPVGFSQIRLSVSIDVDADEKQIEELVAMTQQYAVVFQTLVSPPKLTVDVVKR